MVAGSVGIFLVACLSGAPQTASAAPSLQLPTGKLASLLKVSHTVTVLPLWRTEAPDLARMNAELEAVKTFWSREIPGLRLSFKVLKPVQSKFRCFGPNAFTAAMRAIKGFGTITKMKMGEYAMAWTPDCPMEWVDGQAFGITGLQGRGRIWSAGYSSSTIAHEFGHLLGLGHTGGVICSDWSTVSVSAKALSKNDRCELREYEAGKDIMGSVDDGLPLSAASQFLGPMAQLQFGAKSVKLTGPGTYTIGRPLSGQPVVGLLETNSGLLLVDMVPPVQHDAVEEAGALRVHIPTVDCYGANACGGPGSYSLSFPGLVGRQPASGCGHVCRQFLQAGDAWTIPGTGYRIATLAVNGDQATFEISDASVPQVSPGTPILNKTSDIRAFPLPSTLTWSSVPDAVAYVVMIDGQMVARSTTTSATFVVRNAFAGFREDISVAALSRSGGVTVSATTSFRLRGVTLKVTVPPYDGDPESAVWDTYSKPVPMSFTVEGPEYQAMVTAWGVTLSARGDDSPATPKVNLLQGNTVLVNPPTADVAAKYGREFKYCVRVAVHAYTGTGRDKTVSELPLQGYVPEICFPSPTW